MKKLFLMLGLILIIINSCKKDVEKTQTSVKVGLDGFVQKGPFISGSSISIQELDGQFIPNGKVYNTLTIDDFGSFKIKSTIRSIYTEVIAQGYYFNEVSGSLSPSNITLRSLLKVDPDLVSNVNILTTIAEERIKFLVSEKGNSFDDAVKQAENEVLKIFGIEESSVLHFNTMDMSESGNSNAILIAISSILQGEQSVAQLSEFISKFQIDIKEDGKIDNQNLMNTLIANSSNLNLVQIRQNLENRYKSLGLDLTIPNFEKYAKCLVPLAITTISPIENIQNGNIYATITANFNKAIDVSTLSANSFVVKNSNSEPLPGIYSYTKESNQIVFTPNDKLQPLTQFYIAINSVLKSIDGQSLSEDRTWSFKTESFDIVNNLLMYLPFNGNANDESGHSNNANAVGVTLTKDRFGSDNKAYYFNGENNYIEFPRYISLSGTVWSYSVWFNLDKYPSVMNDAWFLSNKTGDRYADIYAYVDNDGDDVKAYLQTERKIFTNYKISIHNWYHMVVTYNQSEIKIYVNGTLVSTTKDLFTTSLQSNYIISSVSTDGTGRIYGSVDDVRLYNRALNSSEVRLLFETENQSALKSGIIRSGIISSLKSYTKGS